MPKQWINTLFVYGLDVTYLTAGKYIIDRILLVWEDTTVPVLLDPYLHPNNEENCPQFWLKWGSGTYQVHFDLVFITLLNAGNRLKHDKHVLVKFEVPINMQILFHAKFTKIYYNLSKCILLLTEFTYCEVDISETNWNIQYREWSSNQILVGVVSAIKVRWLP